MAFERIVGLDVKDDITYEQYRKNMKPILNEYGGEFGFDFKVSEVLQSKSKENINRVFTIEFPNKEAMDLFFSDARYKKIQAQYMEPSVRSRTIISLHEKNS